MTEQKTTKAHCPSCNGQRNANIVCQHNEEWGDYHDVNGHNDYRILKCCGCETIFFQKEIWCSADECHEYTDSATGEEKYEIPSTITYWPAPTKRDRPEWLYKLCGEDMDLYNLFNEVYVALNNDLGVLAAIGIRTVFDRASELLDVDPALPFGKKIEELVKLGKVGTDEQDTLAVLTDAGSAAAHRGWKPSVKELDAMMSIIEAFLYRNFVLAEATQHLKKNVPPKPKRAKKAATP